MASQNEISTVLLESALSVWSQTGSQHYIPIRGGSMLPIIQEGDRVQITHDCTNIKRGDIIVFQQKGKLVIHRVVSIISGTTESTFVTKGDNVARFDPPVNGNVILGRVLALQRGEQHIALETCAWRRVGWLIALITLMTAAPSALYQRLSQAFLKSSHGSVSVLRGSQRCLRLFLLIVQNLLNPK
ncbi:signal peptidase I [Chloroflexi bacterium TSY]|nr:signal peptidase I [Chloroflexi bacterium TSY]